MAKIFGVKINYGEGINEDEGHKELQNIAMKLLAEAVIKMLPEEAVRELIIRLKENE